MAHPSTTAAIKTIDAHVGRRVQAALAGLLGLALFLGVAFAPPGLIHNAAHDSRHAISVPCH